MAGTLKIVGDGESNSNARTSSYSDFLAEIEKAEASQSDFEATMQRLRITNVQNLGNLRKQQELELIQKTTDLQVELAKKVNDEKEKSLQQEYDDRMAMEEDAFQAKFGMTKKQYQEEWKLKKKNLDLENKTRLKNAQTQAKREAKEAKAKAQKEALEANKKARQGLMAKGATPQERLAAAKKLFSREVRDEEGNVVGSRKANPAEALAGVANLLSDMAKQLDNTITKVASYKSGIDTRLQGSKNNKSYTGSYWDQMSKDITGIAGISPLVRQADITDRVKSMVEKGIAFNVEQRAVLDVVKDKIATTFDAANGTLLRLVRIQQQDTTAGRLGMESALTAFLNNMYETTEYMSSLATSVKSNLEEAMSLMTGENALSFEYQIQKWLGSLYSVGMSDQAVQGLAGTLGKIAAGQLEGITGNGNGTLMVMAANNAGLNITDMLNNGLNADTTNELLNAMVDYLAKIYNQAGDSKVLQQQMASVFGLTASDMKAMVNLSKSRSTVARDGLTYSTAIGRLNSMADTMGKRTSIGEFMENAWGNVQYSMAAGIANNPALYGLYKAASLLDTAAGGIAIPAFSVMGNMVDLETTVADLMRAGAMGGSILGAIGSMIGSGGNGGLTGRGILTAAGITGGISRVTRGTGVGLATTGGASVSESGSMVGNSEGSDVQSKTMTDANDSSKAQLAEAIDESEETKIRDIHNDIVDVYKLLARVIDNKEALNVVVTNTISNPVEVHQEYVDRY